MHNMINKGLILKGAYLSSAFENNGGNRMQISMRFKEDFKKRPKKMKLYLIKQKAR